MDGRVDRHQTDTFIHYNEEADEARSTFLRMYPNRGPLLLVLG